MNLILSSTLSILVCFLSNREKPHLANVLRLSLFLCVDEASFSIFWNTLQKCALYLEFIRFHQMAGGYEFCFQKGDLRDIPY